MVPGLVKIGLAGVAVIAVAWGYRAATKPVNDDFRNYEVGYSKLKHWKDVPHAPNTLLLMRDPKTNALLRCSETQIVAEANAEPDIDTERLVKQVVNIAQENQAEWTTEMVEPYDNGKVKFEIFRKHNKAKEILGAMCVRGNTTLLVSISNTGKGDSSLLEENHQDFRAFLDTISLVATDKWNRIHDRIDSTH